MHALTILMVIVALVLAAYTIALMHTFVTGTCGELAAALQLCRAGSYFESGRWYHADGRPLTAGGP